MHVLCYPQKNTTDTCQASVQTYNLFKTELILYSLKNEIFLTFISVFSEAKASSRYVQALIPNNNNKDNSFIV